VQADSAEWFDYSPRVNASAPLTAAAAAAWLDKYAAMLSAVHDAAARAAAGAPPPPSRRCADAPLRAGGLTGFGGSSAAMCWVRDELPPSHCSRRKSLAPGAVSTA